MSIDIVIATYNRRAALERCLTALAAQTIGADRVIVVDDCSPEPAASWLTSDSFGLPITVISQTTNGGPARARGAGVAASDADVILFVDDDVVADSHLVERHIAAHAGGDRLAVIGPLAAPADWRPTPWNRWEAATLAVEYSRMGRGIYTPTWRQFFTGNASVRRRDFLAVGGFDTRFRRAEDIELGIRLAASGCQFVFEATAIGWHYSYRTRRQRLRTAREYAQADVAIDALYPALRWGRHIDLERSRRHRLTRAAMRLLRATHSETPFAAAVSTAAPLLGRLPSRSSAPNGALSAAYSATYEKALRAARRDGVSWAGTARAEVGVLEF